MQITDRARTLIKSGGEVDLDDRLGNWRSHIRTSRAAVIGVFREVGRTPAPDRVPKPGADPTKEKDPRCTRTRS